MQIDEDAYKFAYATWQSAMERCSQEMCTDDHLKEFLRAYEEARRTTAEPGEGEASEAIEEYYRASENCIIESIKKADDPEAFDAACKWLNKARLRLESLYRPASPSAQPSKDVAP